MPGFRLNAYARNRIGGYNSEANLMGDFVLRSLMKHVECSIGRCKAATMAAEAHRSQDGDYGL